MSEPVSGIEAPRERELIPDGTLPDAGELEVAVGQSDFDLNLFTKADGTGGMRLHYCEAHRVCTIDRTGLDRRFNEQVGEILDVPLEKEFNHLRIFIDRSSVEFYINHGEAVFTSHAYPTENEFHFSISGNSAVKLWKLKASVTDNFII